jgi:hypothetical protein
MKKLNSLNNLKGLSPFPCPNPSCPLVSSNSLKLMFQVYPDAAAAKDQILKDNKGKAGVYLIFFC